MKGKGLGFSEGKAAMSGGIRSETSEQKMCRTVSACLDVTKCERVRQFVSRVQLQQESDKNAQNKGKITQMNS